MKTIFRSLLPATLLVATPLAYGQQEADPSVRLREQLRAVTLQLRTAQTDAANARALQAASDQKVTALEEKNTTLQTNLTAAARRAEEDKETSDQKIATLGQQLEETNKNLTLHKEALVKWQAGYQKAAATANTREEQRAALASELTEARRLIADRERKNIALFNTATEILDRYEKHSLGRAISAREPFIGTTRVKVENLVQDYKDQILDQRVAAPAKPASTAATR